ncbi:MAG: two-component sensor histidine kinase, partial [Deltaproteobacteria bacterium]
MPFSEWATLAACAGQLGLAVLVMRAPRGSLTPPLALLCLVLFTWNAAGVIDRTGGGDAWKWVDVVTSPWTVPLGLHFFLAFVGLRRRHRILLYVTYALFGLFSALTALSAFVPFGRGFPWGNTWPLVYLALLMPTVGAGTAVLVRHLLEAKSAEEVVRARLLLSGLAVALAVGLTELLTGFGVRVISLSGPGMLVVTAIMAVLTLRWGLLEDIFRRRTAIFAFSVSLVGLIAYFAVFDLISDNLALLLFATVIATLAATVVTRYLLSLLSARRERVAELLTLGRFSQQMAHDLKNPIAAMKGAVQYLQEE